EGKAEEEVHSDSTHESDFEAMLYWPSSAPGNDTSEDEELVDDRGEEEEMPNHDQNQGRVTLTAIHIPSRLITRNLKGEWGRQGRENMNLQRMILPQTRKLRRNPKTDVVLEPLLERASTA
nr:hypothetical protein [Tanacetum cinerariifolium]